MTNSIISEGKTTAEAIENGLKKLGVKKDRVEVKVLEEEEKRSFFSILTPRVVKVELTLKEQENKKEKQYSHNSNGISINSEKVKEFLDDFVEKIGIEGVSYKLEIKDEYINIELLGENINNLIGYRGEVLNSIQTILSAIINKDLEEKVKVALDIKGYKNKREKALEELAEKIAKTVIRTGKSISLEPMTAYERKVIHTKLQENTKVKTISKGEEPYRKIIVELK